MSMLRAVVWTLLAWALSAGATAELVTVLGEGVGQ
jgi:hypothetical protein